MGAEGLERYDWESAYATLEPLLDEYPEEALPELLALVERMLAATAMPAGRQANGAPGHEPALAPIREIVQRVAEGHAVPRPAVARATDELKAVYEAVHETSREARAA